MGIMAARGGIEGGTLPLGWIFCYQCTDAYMANFKPQEGDYAAIQALYTVELGLWQTI